jgi:hypothetical protein
MPSVVIPHAEPIKAPAARIAVRRGAIFRSIDSTQPPRKTEAEKLTKLPTGRAMTCFSTLPVIRVAGTPTHAAQQQAPLSLVDGLMPSFISISTFPFDRCQDEFLVVRC